MNQIMIVTVLVFQNLQSLKVTQKDKSAKYQEEKSDQGLIYLTTNRMTLMSLMTKNTFKNNQHIRLIFNGSIQDRLSPYLDNSY